MIKRSDLSLVRPEGAPLPDKALRFIAEAARLFPGCEKDVIPVRNAEERNSPPMPAWRAELLRRARNMVPNKDATIWRTLKYYHNEIFALSLEERKVLYGQLMGEMAKRLDATTPKGQSRHPPTLIEKNKGYWARANNS